MDTKKFLKIIIKFRDYLYHEHELDILFQIFLFIGLDKNFSNFNLKYQTQLVFQSIVDILKHRALWTPEKHALICANILGIIKADKLKTQSIDLNNIYHRMIHLNGYFKQSLNILLRKLSSDLAYNFINELLNESNEQFETLSITSNVSS